MTNAKFMGKSTRKPLRRTPMHEKLTEAVRDLIRLYYLFGENKPFVPVMKDLLKRITGDDFEHRAPPEFLARELAMAKENYFINKSKERVMHFDEDQKSTFVYLMDIFHKAIKELTVYHFSAVKWVYGVETSIENAEIEANPTDTPDDAAEGSRVTKSIPEKLIYKQAIQALENQEPEKLAYSLKGEGWKQVEGSIKGVKVISIPHRVYKVRPDTRFGRQLLEAEMTLRMGRLKQMERAATELGRIADLLERKGNNKEEIDRGSIKVKDLSLKTPLDELSLDRDVNYGEVLPINFYGMTYFIQVARSLLVNYHILFGNFEYIKACEWEECQKLFVEERKGRKRFCSDDCERRFKQASPIYKCWNRHTAWIRREVDKIKKEVDALGFALKAHQAYKPQPEYVSMDVQCKSCLRYMDTGECTALKDKNKKVLSIQKGLPDIQKGLLDIQKESSKSQIQRKELANKLKHLLSAPTETTG